MQGGSTTKLGMEPLRIAERKAKTDLVGLGRPMKPWRIDNIDSTDNTRERSLSKIPRTTLIGKD